MHRIVLIIRQTLLVLIGASISALVFSQLIVPNQMLSGGLAGLTLIFDQLTGWRWRHATLNQYSHPHSGVPADWRPLYFVDGARGCQLFVYAGLLANPTGRR
jgi:hypothetical protein